jgi:hypothetical protein
VSCESTISIFDVHLSFEPSTECEGAEGAIPDAIIEFFETDIFPGAGGGDIDPLSVPPNAPVGAHVAHLAAVGRLERWRFDGHGTWGRGRAGDGCTHAADGGPVARRGSSAPSEG